MWRRCAQAQSCHGSEHLRSDSGLFCILPTGPKVKNSITPVTLDLLANFLYCNRTDIINYHRMEVELRADQT